MTATAGPERSGSAFGVPEPSTTTWVTGDAARAATVRSKLEAIRTARRRCFIGKIIQSVASVFVEVRMSEPSINPAASEQRLPLYVGTSGWAYAIWKPEFY